MGVMRQGRFTTMLGAEVVVLPVTREDDADALLAISVPDERDGIEVLLSSADRVALRELLGES